MTPPNNTADPVQNLKELISALLNEPVFQADLRNTVAAGLISSNGKLLRLLPGTEADSNNSSKGRALDTASEAFLFVLLATGNTVGADEIIHAAALKARNILSHIAK